MPVFALQLTSRVVYVGGSPGLVPGLITGALACTLLQWSYNELGIARVRFISRNQHSQVTTPPADFHRPSSPLPTSSDHNSAGSPSPTFERLLRFIGVRYVPEEERLAKMKVTRDGYLRQIAALEKETNEESRDNWSKSGDSS